MIRHATEQARVGISAALYWANTQLHQAFDTWRAVVAHALKKQSKSSFGKCVAHWMHRKLSGGFNKWHSTAMCMLFQRQQLYRGACLWSRQGATKAINTWRADTEYQLHYMEKLYKAMFRWAHSSLSAAFSTWMAKAAHERMDEMLDIAMQHYRYASIFVVLDHWRDVTNEIGNAISDNIQEQYKADSHRRYSALRASFDGWKEDWRLMERTPVTVDQTAPSNVLAQACRPYGMFECSITGTIYGKADRHLYYVVQVNFAGRQLYKLEKRYRDFDLLNAPLSERFGGILRGSGSAFPPKKPFTKLNPEFYESRVGDLHAFIQELIKHGEIAGSGELC